VSERPNAHLFTKAGVQAPRLAQLVWENSLVPKHFERETFALDGYGASTPSPNCSSRARAYRDLALLDLVSKGDRGFRQWCSHLSVGHEQVAALGRERLVRLEPEDTDEPSADRELARPSTRWRRSGMRRECPGRSGVCAGPRFLDDGDALTPDYERSGEQPRRGVTTRPPHRPRQAQRGRTQPCVPARIRR